MLGWTLAVLMMLGLALAALAVWVGRLPVHVEVRYNSRRSLRQALLRLQVGPWERWLALEVGRAPRAVSGPGGIPVDFAPSDAAANPPPPHPPLELSLQAVLQDLAHLRQHWHQWWRDLPGHHRHLLEIAWKSLQELPIQADLVQWEVRAGTGDPATTAWGAGILWSVLSPVTGWLLSHAHPASPPRFRVIPDFQQRTFQASVRCILSLRAGDIMRAGWRAWKIMRSRRLASAGDVWDFARRWWKAGVGET
ncbi:MAG: DUF2953 domain-containing protein [Firmicutes bacterium]|nr:DUF2953 domain-containing protein [Bacillota bacterium]